MSDQFNTGIQLPNVSVGENARNPQDGYIRVYAKAGALISRLPDGTEVDYTKKFQNLFFQMGGGELLVPATADENQPFLLYRIDGAVVTPYLWEPI